MRFLVFLVLIFLGGCVQGVKECYVDSDCVADECCHASGCVSVRDKPDCTGVFCSMECVPNTLDCGQGECKCVGGRCKAVFY